MAVDNEDEVPPLPPPLLPDVHSQPTISSQMRLTHSRPTISNQMTLTHSQPTISSQLTPTNSYLNSGSLYGASYVQSPIESTGSYFHSVSQLPSTLDSNSSWQFSSPLYDLLLSPNPYLVKELEMLKERVQKLEKLQGPTEAPNTTAIGGLTSEQQMAISMITTSVSIGWKVAL